MKKEFWKSKTVWGALVFALSGFLTTTGWVPESLVTELVKWLSGFFTVYGIRDALN